MKYHLILLLLLLTSVTSGCLEKDTPDEIDESFILAREKMVNKHLMGRDITDPRVLEAYLTQYIEDDALIIILGDHQPNVQITGENSLWSVPIHVISRNPVFLESFAKRGYTPGLIPQQPLPHPGMETFLYDFLEDFSTRTSESAMK